MKKNKVLLIALVLIFSIKLSAQNGFKIGINAGINYPDIRGHEYAKYNNFKVGYLIGVSFDYSLKQNLSLIANINYEKKTKKFQLTYYNYEAEEIGKEDFEEIFEYINLPILLKYEFGNSKYFANTGPFLNYLFNQSIEPDYANEDSDLLTEKRKIDFGLSVGIGTKISLNKKSDLIIEIRDDFGLVDTGGVPKHLGGTVKTNTIKLILGWKFGI